VKKRTSDTFEVVSHDKEIPDATVSRLPVYRRSLVELAAEGQKTVSSARLAELAGVNAAKVRKDLSHLGTYGVRGVGYEVEFLLRQVGEVLGLDHDAPVVIVGIGNLGQALARYSGFSSRGFPVVALVDTSHDIVGKFVEGLAIHHVDDLPSLVAELDVAVGIIATPAEAAQDVANALVEAGVGSILNFAPAIVRVPAHVPTRKVDLSTELQILSYYSQRESLEDGRSA
jgi:redox-sensing transcriptional repressor